MLPIFKLQLNTIFTDTIQQFKIIVDTLITTKVKSVSFLGEMGGYSTANAVIVIYMRWIKINPGVMFSVDNRFHVNQIKDMYLRSGNDWRSDPIIGKLEQSVEQTTCRKVSTTREIISHTL